ELARVDEQGLTGTVTPTVLEVPTALVASQKPKACRNAGGQEQLRRQRHDAIDEIGLNDALADLSLASRLRRQRAVRHNEAGHAASVPVWRREMVDEVLDPGIIRI